MQLASLLCLFLNCFKSKTTILLPEDLICHILVEYLPDQPQNRLISKRIRDDLDRKYNKISGCDNENGSCRREMINMKAIIKLKSGHDHFDLCEYLKSGDLMIRRMAVKLIKELKYSYQLEIPVLIRLLLESRCIDEFYKILSIAGYRNFFAFKSTLAYQNLPRSEKLTLEDTRYNLLNQDRINRHSISYCRAFTFK